MQTLQNNHFKEIVMKMDEQKTLYDNDYMYMKMDMTNRYLKLKYIMLYQASFPTVVISSYIFNNITD